MTLIVSWASIDKKGNDSSVSAVYILTDSRISWGNSHHWDNGRKIFNFLNHPDILGYCGDVLFPTQVLTQITTLGDIGFIFNKNDSFLIKSNKIFGKIQELFNNYPQVALLPNFSIIHCGKEINGQFGCRKLCWSKNNGWNIIEIPFKNQSSILDFDGSGKFEFESNIKLIGYNFSREICQIFFDTLKNIKDPYCGGAPQLAGVYRGDQSQNFGIIYNNKKFILGMEIPDNDNFPVFEWRNELFERCDPYTNSILPKAQRQPKIRNKPINKTGRFGKKS